jgi:glycosyltransferase involved in cell wall biosynthesis
MKPLVSILIPAYNAEKWIAETIQSAIAQTWPRKEIIVIDDGSTDRTAEIAQAFVPGITVISTENRGLSAAVNLAYRYSHGDYIQELDADDLLLPDKIERQLGALREGDSKRILLSSPWAPFYYRTGNIRFVKNSFWEDLTPVEWLLRKMNEGIHMQNATWLISREVAEAAGPWDESLHYDQDGEYFARALAASEGTRFVPGTGVLYRVTGRNRVSYIGNSDRKKDSLFRSMMLHIQYLRSLNESERARKACVTYMQIFYGVFYPSRMDIAAELQGLAVELGGRLHPQALRWKYAWIEPLFGRKIAQHMQSGLPQVKLSCIRHFEKAMYKLEGLRTNHGAQAGSPRGPVSAHGRH